MWYWPLIAPGWLLTLISLGLMVNNSVDGGTVAVGPNIAATVGTGVGGAAASSSNQLSSATGDGSISYVGYGIILAGGGSKGNGGPGNTQPTRQVSCSTVSHRCANGTRVKVFQ